MADTSTEARTEAADRGTLDVRVKALEHIAERAALLTDGVVAHRGSLGPLGSLVGTGSPKASVRIDTLGATVTLDVAAVWPCPVAEIGRDVRDRVLSEATRLSGLTIRTVDVTVQLVDPDDVDHTHRRRVQ